ncbi:zinc transporter ZntB [Marinomonas epiphytica]
MTNFVLYHLELNGCGGAAEESLLPKEVPTSGCRWLHLDGLMSESKDCLNNVDGIPEAVIEALFADETRPRTVRIGGGLLINLRGVNLNPESNPSDMVSLRMWATPNFIVSTRMRKLLSVQSVVADLQLSQGPCSTADIVSTLAETLTERMESVIHSLEETLSDLEESVSVGTESGLRDVLVQKRLETIRLRRFLVPQKEAIQKLLLESASWMTADQLIQIQEAANHITRYVEALESLRERCLLLQEEFVNQHAERMNGRMYVLSVLSGIFLPLGFLTGLFGINIGGMPGTDNTESFWIFCGVLFVLGVGQFLLMRRSRWF